MNEPNIIECEAAELDETIIALAERGYRIANQERTLSGVSLQVEPCDCDGCRLARGQPLSSDSRESQR